MWHKQSRRALLAAFLLFGGVGCSRSRSRPATATVTVLDQAYGSLRADFARDAGHPRLLVVVSPT